MCRSIGSPRAPRARAREDRLDHEQARAIGHRGAASGEDAHGVGVVPVVEDAREQVGVGAVRNRGEEVAGHALGAVAEAFASRRGARPGSRPGGPAARRGAPARRRGSPPAGSRGRRRRRRAGRRRRSRRRRRRLAPPARSARPSTPGTRPRARDGAPGARRTARRGPARTRRAAADRVEQAGRTAVVELAACDRRPRMACSDSPSEVRPKLPSSCSSTTPSTARPRSTRVIASRSAPTASATSWPSRGPSDNASGIPSLAATYRSCVTTYPSIKAASCVSARAMHPVCTRSEDGALSATGPGRRTPK